MKKHTYCALLLLLLNSLPLYAEKATLLEDMSLQKVVAEIKKQAAQKPLLIPVNLQDMFHVPSIDALSQKDRNKTMHLTGKMKRYRIEKKVARREERQKEVALLEEKIERTNWKLLTLWQPYFILKDPMLPYLIEEVATIDNVIIVGTLSCSRQHWDTAVEFYQSFGLNFCASQNKNVPFNATIAGLPLTLYRGIIFAPFGTNPSDEHFATFGYSLNETESPQQ